MKFNLAIQLTLLRLLLVPVFLVFTVIDNVYTRILALLIFIAASLTDLYDGRIARKKGLVTTLGIFLDPLADKFLISSAFIAFVQIPEIYVPAWMVVLIIGREFLITGLRTLAVSRGRILAAQPAGKFKTTSQLVAIITILVILTLNSMLEKWGPSWGWGRDDGSDLYGFVTALLFGAPYWLTFATTVLTIFSGYVYLRDNADLLVEPSVPSSRP